MIEWICLGCHKVASSGPTPTICCPEKGLLPFVPADHGHLLVGSSNAWNQIAHLWDDNPLYKEVLQDMHQRGCYGAATTLAAFVDRLIELEAEAGKWQDCELHPPTKIGKYPTIHKGNIGYVLHVCRWSGTGWYGDDEKLNFPTQWFSIPTPEV